MGISATNPARLPSAAASTPDEKFTYVYNPWGQLVEIKNLAGTVTHAKYTYSAMGHRISEQLDTNDSSNSGVGDGVVDAYDPVFFIATDPAGGGRRLATYRGTDSDPKETFIHHDARIRGPVHQGGPILRDRDADLADKPFYWASEPAASDRYERHYYALDCRGYVSAIFAGDGTLVEQVRYSGTGVPFNIPLGDVNGDGKVEAGTGSDPDWNQIEYMWKTPAYHVRGDLDLDGDVDAADLAIAQARDGTGTGRGFITTLQTDHRIVSPIWESEAGPFEHAINSTDRSVMLLGKLTFLNSTVGIDLLNPFITWSQPPDQCATTTDSLANCQACCKKNLGANSDDPAWLDECNSACVERDTPPRCKSEQESPDCGKRCARQRRLRNRPGALTPPGGGFCCICTVTLFEDFPLLVPDIILTTPGADRSANLLIACMEKHEQVHLRQCGGTLSCRECPAHQAELGCLAVALQACRDIFGDEAPERKVCEDIVRARTRQVEQSTKEYCDGCQRGFEQVGPRVYPTPCRTW